MDIEGYRECGNDACGNMVLDFTAWQTGGVCFDCFINGDMARVREIEVIERATRHKIDAGPANAKRSPGKAKRKPTENVRQADLARLRAARRLSRLFPEVFDILYAEERWKAGLQPKPHPHKNHLKNAVETYVAFAAYHAASDRSG
jgi:hypothetical protein